MFNNLKIVMLIVIGLVFQGNSAFSADFHSPRTDALGGAGHASPLLTDAIYLNPSFTSFIQNHAISTEYLLFNGGTINGPQGPTDYYGHNFNVSILDGSPDSMFQAGAGFTRRDDANLVHIGASKAFLQRFGVGVGSKLVFPNNASITNFGEASVSVSSIVSDWFQASFGVDNLLQVATNLGFYREYTLGTKFNVSSILLIYFDPNWVPTLPNGQNTWGYQAGMEFPFFRELFFRLGEYSNSLIPYENVRGTGWGIGLGWIGPKINLDYAFSRTFNPILSNSHNMQVTIFF